MKGKVASYSCYQSDLAVAEYCDAHYGPDKFRVGNFSATLIKHCLARMEDASRRRALDLGCAVGRSSFELAVYFDKVVAIDYSSRFIDIARRIQRRGVACYCLVEEGVVLSDHRVALAELGLAQTADKVTFQQGDALNLDEEYGRFDLVLAANLIDRLSRPAKFLANIHRRLAPGGLLVIASPYDWQESFTPCRCWLGGRFHAGSPRFGQEALGRQLRRHFIMDCPPINQEFILRRTARTFYHNISQVTFWRCEG